MQFFNLKAYCFLDFFVHYGVNKLFDVLFAPVFQSLHGIFTHNHLSQLHGPPCMKKINEEHYKEYAISASKEESGKKLTKSYNTNSIQISGLSPIFAFKFLACCSFSIASLVKNPATLFCIECCKPHLKNFM